VVSWQFKIYCNKNRKYIVFIHVIEELNMLCGGVVLGKPLPLSSPPPFTHSMKWQENFSIITWGS
jgi:hypothetical protein